MEEMIFLVVLVSNQYSSKGQKIIPYAYHFSLCRDPLLRYIAYTCLDIHGKILLGTPVRGDAGLNGKSFNKTSKGRQRQDKHLIKFNEIPAHLIIKLMKCKKKF